MRILQATTALALGATLCALVGAAPAPAEPAPAPASGPAAGAHAEARELDPATRADPGPVRTDALPDTPADVMTGPGAKPRARATKAPGGPGVGDMRWFLALDDVEGYAYFKEFRLRGTDPGVQVWVAEDTAFPEGDCRNDLGLAHVSDAQVDRLVSALGSTIRPRVAEVFGAEPPRNGTGGAALAEEVGLPEDHWQVAADQADDLVVLVDNIRDDNYYTPTAPTGRSFVAGFFTSTFTELLDRNIVTLDAYDWLHRSGPTPPDDTADPAYQACGAALGGTLGTARPFGYEAILAHEYTHLLQHETDADEVTWISEGLADWAQTLTGYVDPRVDPATRGADPHLRCFSGHAGPEQGGPENSLTQWGDQGAVEVLCDYGAAYSFVEYLHSHHGSRLLRAVHDADRNGLAGVQQALTTRRAGVSARELVRRWAAAVAVDRVLDRNGRRSVGAAAAPLTARSLTFSVAWDNPRTHDAPGAPPNGSDYVRLRDATGRWLTTGDLQSLRFRGARSADGRPVDGWIVQLVAYDDDRLGEPLRYHRLRLDRSWSGRLATRELRGALGWRSPLVAAVVTHEDPDEDATAPAAYRLEVNGVLQPGGGSEAGGGS